MNILKNVYEALFVNKHANEALYRAMKEIGDLRLKIKNLEDDKKELEMKMLMSKVEFYNDF